MRNIRTLRLVMALGVVHAGLGALADPTPMTAALPEDEITMIACALPKNEKPPERDQPADGLYHYRLYVPKGYQAHPERRYPCMFIADPGGNAQLGAMAERLKRDRWLVIMLVESRNGTPVWRHSFVAAHDDAVKRLRILEGMKFGTGMSGGARCCCSYPELRPGFRGMILQAAGFHDYDETEACFKRQRELLLYATFGNTDVNLVESVEDNSLERRVPPGRRLVEVWDGQHGWCPAETFDRALDWMEDKIFGAGKLPPKSSDLALWRGDQLRDRLAAAKTPFAKYELLEQLLLLDKAAPTAAGGAKGEESKAWRTELTTLGSDPEIRKELAARQAWAKVRENEEQRCLAPGRDGEGTTRNKRTRKAKRDQGTRQDLAADYTQMAQKHEGTRYAEVATLRAKSLTLQATATRTRK